MSIGTKICELGWPWTAICPNFTWFRWYGKQQWPNEWSRPVLSATEL